MTSVQIAINKAFTAAGQREPTHQCKNAYAGEEAFGIFTQHEGRFTVFVCGFPIFADGEQDTAVCEAGIRTFMAHLGKIVTAFLNFIGGEWRPSARSTAAAVAR